MKWFYIGLFKDGKPIVENLSAFAFDLSP